MKKMMRIRNDAVAGPAKRDPRYNAQAPAKTPFTQPLNHSSLPQAKQKMSKQVPQIEKAQAQFLMSQLLDGELSSTDAAKLEAYLESNPDAIDWMESADALREAKTAAPFKTDRDVAISSIQTAIRDEMDSPANHGGRLLRFPAFARPLAAAAAITLLGVASWIAIKPAEQEAPLEPAIVEFVATDIPDASTFVYSDEESGWTIVWVEEQG